MDQRYGIEVWNRGMEQRYGTDPSKRYGTGVWNGGMERMWSRSLFRTSYFDLHPYICTYLPRHTKYPFLTLKNVKDPHVPNQSGLPSTSKVSQFLSKKNDAPLLAAKIPELLLLSQLKTPAA